MDRVRPRKVDPEQVKSLWEKGFSDRRIARILGVSPSAVRRWRRKLGLPGKPGRRRVVDLEQLRSLWEQGYTDRRIASALGVSVYTVRHHRRRMGLRRPVVRKVDPELLRKLWESGLAVAEIAKALGVHPTAVQYHRRKLGLPSRRRAQAAVPPEVKEEVYARVAGAGVVWGRVQLRSRAERAALRELLEEGRVKRALFPSTHLGRLGRKLKVGQLLPCAVAYYADAGLFAETVAALVAGRIAGYSSVDRVSIMKALKHMLNASSLEPSAVEAIAKGVRARLARAEAPQPRAT